MNKEKIINTHKIENNKIKKSKNLHQKVFVSFILSFFFAFFSFSIFSCKENKKSAKEEKFNPKLPTDIQGKIEIYGHYRNFESLEEEFDRFNAIYPNVQLSYTFLDDYNNTILLAMAGGNAPNIYTTFDWMIGKDKYDLLFESAEDLKDSEKVGFTLSSFRQPLLYQDENGKISMIPIFCNTYGMLVNETLLQKEALPIPQKYEEFIETCKKLKERGYKSPVMGYNNASSPLYTALAYPFFYKDIQFHTSAVALLNDMDPSAGIFLRETLTFVKDFMDQEIVDLEECKKLKDNYNAVLLRFLDGDVPFMFVTADNVSGTEKRETLSENFKQSPFKYSFHTVPISNEGGIFLNTAALNFSVNKNKENLQLTNEFIRFLTQTLELNNIANVKRLVTTSTDYSYDTIYSSLEKSSPLYMNEIGIMDNVLVQLKKAVYQVATNQITIDEAIASYGKF